MVNTLQKQIVAKQKEKEEVTLECNNYIYLFVFIIRVIITILYIVMRRYIDNVVYCTGGGEV